MIGSQRDRRSAFTLVELLVVIAIIGVLVALLLPAVQAAREAARRTACTNNLHQIGIAIHNYHDTQLVLPYGSDYPYLNRNTWSKAILPYMELQNHFDKFDHTKPFADTANAPLCTIPIKTYICPSDPRALTPILENRGEAGASNPSSCTMLSYPACMGPTHPDACFYCSDPTPSPTNWCCLGCNFGTFGCGGSPDGSTAGMFGRWTNRMMFANVTDGLSNTIMAGETIPSHYIWNGVFCANFPVSSTNIPINTKFKDGGLHGGHGLMMWARSSGYKSYHQGGAMFVFGDAAVKFLPQNIDFKAYNHMGTREGGETVAVP